MKIFLFLLLWLVVLIVSSFVAWRRYREDYGEEDGFLLTGQLLVGALVTGWGIGVLFMILESTSSWLSISLAVPNALGCLVGLYLGGVWFHLDHKRWWGDVLDASLEGWLWAMCLWQLGMVMGGSWQWQAWIGVGGVGLGLLSYHILRRYYRQFYWYKSGKVGFVYWVGLMVVCLFELVLGSFSVGWLRLATILWAIGVLGWATYSLYMISGRKWRDDFGWIKR